MTYLDRFELVVLDMNGTFMFDQDRFGEGEDFAATYRALGASDLPDATISRAVLNCCAHLNRFYDDPAYHDDFPSVSKSLLTISEAEGMNEAQRRRIEAVVATHELGRISEAHGDLLQSLASKHRLALLSNLWSEPAPWRRYFSERGLDGIFESMLFSSETRSIKPSPKLFRSLLERAAVAPSEAVYIGDDMARDVAGAKAAGLAAVWISHGRRFDPAQAPEPERIVATLDDVVDLRP